MLAIQSKQPLGSDLIDNLWSRMSLMSEDKTITHELHSFKTENFNFPKGELLHQDGWGIAYLKNGKMHAYHSLDALYTSDIPRNIYHEICNSTLVLLHARKASPGLDVSADMCHPFIREGEHGQFTLCHNGTINDKDKIIYNKQKYDLNGIESDSLMFLYSLMSKKDSNPKIETIDLMTETVKNSPSYSGLNLLVVIGNQLYGMTNFTRFEKYFTLKYNKSDTTLVISSEEIPELGLQWADLGNHSIISFS